jgi:septum formation protein
MILASTSPRRAQLLQAVGVQFTAVAPHPEAEVALPTRLAREPLLQELVAVALAKARDVLPAYLGQPVVVVGADTTVYFRDRILGKPSSSEVAEKSLALLSGRMHRVLTAVALIDARSERELSRVDEARVYFRNLSAAQIARYVATGEPLDKAGAYGIQGLGGLLVDKIQGRHDTVVGLSLAGLELLLEQLHLSLYEFRDRPLE